MAHKTQCESDEQYYSGSSINIEYDIQELPIKIEVEIDNVMTDTTTNHNTPIKCEPMRVKEEYVDTDTTTNHNVYVIDPIIDIKCEPLRIKIEPACDYSHSGRSNDHIHNDTQHYQCLICLKLFQRKLQLYKHIHHHSIHIMTDKTQCESDAQYYSGSSINIECDIQELPIKFKTDVEIDNVMTDTTTNHTPIVYDIDPTIDIKCEPLRIKDEQPTCDYSHSGQSNDHIHNDTQHFQCLICLKLFQRKLQLYQHIYHHANKKILKGRGKTPRGCDICHQKFTTKQSMAFHMRTHTGEKPYECKICNKRFSRRHYLTLHMLIHAEEKSYACDICNKRFKQPQVRSAHMRIHTGDKPYVCNICDYRSIEKSCITVHMRTHTGEKPYECDICHKRYSQPQHLTRHMRTHTGEKPHVCDICNKRFNQPHYLRDHMRTHTGEKRYGCDICNKRFSRSGNLKIHVRTHTGEKPYRCEVCQKGFADRGNLTAHMRCRHN